MLVSLRCEPAVALAAAHAEAEMPPSQRGAPLLSNERLHDDAGWADLMRVYMCAPQWLTGSKRHAACDVPCVKIVARVLLLIACTRDCRS